VCTQTSAAAQCRARTGPATSPRTRPESAPAPASRRSKEHHHGGDTPHQTSPAYSASIARLTGAKRHRKRHRAVRKDMRQDVYSCSKLIGKLPRPTRTIPVRRKSSWRKRLEAKGLVSSSLGDPTLNAAAKRSAIFGSPAKACIKPRRRAACCGLRRSGQMNRPLSHSFAH